MKKKLVFLSIFTLILSAALIFTLTQKNNPPAKEIVLSREQIEPYINLKGWKCTLIKEEEIKLPSEYNGFYKEYTDALTLAGFNPEKYKGKTVRRYLYSIENHPDKNVCAEILTCNNILVSSALILQAKDGYIKPL